MSIFNIHQAKTQFSQLINLALEGEEVIIARDNRPLIQLTPYKQILSPRKGGQLQGMMSIADDFDAPMPQTWLDQFYGCSLRKQNIII